MNNEPLTALESCIELFEAYAVAPSMSMRSRCDQADRARAELGVLRLHASAAPDDPSRDDRLFTAACHALGGMLASSHAEDVWTERDDPETEEPVFETFALAAYSYASALLSALDNRKAAGK